MKRSFQPGRRQTIRGENMAKISVEYTATVQQVINWPDDELDDLNLENIECNLDISEATNITVNEITTVKKNGVITEV